MYRHDSAVSPTLADLSRAASTVSTSSSDEASVFIQPPRRPLRSFNAPSPSPARSPARVAPHITRDLAVADPEPDNTPTSSPVKTNNRSRSRNLAPTADDFEFGDTLGEGSFSTCILPLLTPYFLHSCVFVGTLKRTGQQYAIKEISKNHIQRHKKQATILAEKASIIALRDHPGIVNLHFTFQDTYNLYFVLDLAKNGELHALIKRIGSLSIPCAQYFASQVVDALSYMHSKNVIHRDIKPENILITDDYHIQICDFGTAKILGSYDERTRTMNVGTAQYVSPEYLDTGQTSRSSDLWALGCVIYQMITGKFAFHGLSDYLIFQKIKKHDYSYPDGMDPTARDLIDKLLMLDPAARLGAGPIGSPSDMSALRRHPFFAGLMNAWDSVLISWDQALSSPTLPPDELEWDSESQPFYENGGRTTPSPLPPSQDKSLGAPEIGIQDVERAVMDRSDTLDSKESSSSGTGRLSMSSRDPGYETERGRKQMRLMTEGEQVLFHSAVEVKSLRRRASLLLPRSLPPVPPKMRELFLTDRRLILVKVRSRPPGETVLKQELFLKSADKAKDKDKIVSVEAKGERGIIILTANKSHSYAVHDPGMAAVWVRKISSVLTSPTSSVNGHNSP
ncbi:kinase-like protein [Flagelloscypha sp. PMI_526]|nr:kinase-like protein [Flagelloscypha sp. PMI_526]